MLETGTIFIFFYVSRKLMNKRFRRMDLIDSFFIMDPRITGLKDCVGLLKYLLQVHMLDILLHDVRNIRHIVLPKIKPYKEYSRGFATK